MKKLTRKEQDKIRDAETLKYFQERGFHEDNLAQGLYDTVEYLRREMNSYLMQFSNLNPTPAAVEIIEAMQRALTELSALEQKYFPDPVEVDEDEEEAA